ncbi:hypothetical protein QFZ81_005988 [Paenibacillus sp. V4I9]|uniref:hypothetical protein n=1 Tax=Paenibacillus sp. V4I9 TaxID=3042308 RepID=UPI00277DFAC3|nr:hypothetical protein [Paenibacillus sp. V4I9]MDQ0890900.1 hypothetical protein [Paenibacillus sp. V4I9]
MDGLQYVHQKQEAWGDSILCFFYTDDIDSLPHFYTVRRYNVSGKHLVLSDQGGVLCTTM